MASLYWGHGFGVWGLALRGTLLIQSRAERVCLEDTMSVSGCPPSIGARRLGGQCPDWTGETLVKRLQGSCSDCPDDESRRVVVRGARASVLQAFPLSRDHDA